jgi:hypothetical protein
MGAEQGAEAQQALQMRDTMQRHFSMQIISENTDRSLLKTQIGADNSYQKPG